MGNGYNNNYHHHHLQFHQKSIFWPMLCRLSIKDVKLDNNHNRIPADDNDPKSPRVSCMGQVKRNNRVIGFPTTTTAAVGGNHHTHHKYTKLKKLFSSKTLMGPTTVTVAAPACDRTRSRSCRANKDMCVSNSTMLKLRKDGGRNGDDRQKHCSKVVNIGEIDPPLPVVKKAVPPPGINRDNEVNLWRRRFNRAGLETLQIQQINCQVQPPTTV